GRKFKGERLIPRNLNLHHPPCSELRRPCRVIRINHTRKVSLPLSSLASTRHAQHLRRWARIASHQHTTLTIPAGVAINVAFIRTSADPYIVRQRLEVP